MFRSLKPTHAPTRIEKGGTLVTEITFLHCSEDKQDDVVATAKAALEALVQSPGFTAVNVLKSTDGSRVCLYNQWRNENELKAARKTLHGQSYEPFIETDSGGPRLYDIVYADDKSKDGVSIIAPDYRGTIFINEICTSLENQNRLIELVVANNEASSFKTPGYRSANLHKSRDGARAVNYSLWDSEDHLIQAITDMAASDVNLEETTEIANPDFRFYTLAFSQHV